MEEYHRRFSAYYYIEIIVVPTLIFYCEDDQIVDRYSVGVEFENCCTSSENQKRFKIKNINSHRWSRRPFHTYNVLGIDNKRGLK